MTELTVVTPPTASTAIDHDLVALTEYLASVTGEEYLGGLLGGRFGYGTEYENDTFLMHPFCWCERDDCPWCGGCQSEEIFHPGHSGDCYQTRLRVIRPAVGAFSSPAYQRARTELCREMGLDPDFGSEVHCTCDGSAEATRRYKACQCDWHLGNGPFRFGKATGGPNFWHKPSGLRINWYKWIGRSMEFSFQPTNSQWRAIYAECIASISPVE